MSDSMARDPRIIRAKKHPADPETTARLITHLRGIPGTRVILFPRHSVPKAMDGIVLLGVILLMVGFLLGYIDNILRALAQQGQFGFMHGPELLRFLEVAGSSIGIFIAVPGAIFVALAPIALIAVWIACKFWPPESEEANGKSLDRDERYEAFGIAGTQIHYAQLVDGEIYGYTKTINPRRSVIRDRGWGCVTYKVPYVPEDGGSDAQYIVLRDLPVDAELERILSASVDFEVPQGRYA